MKLPKFWMDLAGGLRNWLVRVSAETIALILAGVVLATCVSPPA